MKARLFIMLTLVVSLALALALAWAVAAQGPELPVAPQRNEPPPQPTPAWDWDSEKPLPQPVAPVDMSNQAASSAVPLGQSGLSFRYVRTFGETLVPYLADNDHLFRPGGVAVDPAGNVYITEIGGHRMMKFTANGIFTMSIGQPGISLADNTNRLGGPRHLAIDAAGNIWIVEGVSRVSKWSPTGTYVSQLGKTHDHGSDNDRFRFPYGIAFDSAGRVYVGDTDNHRIQIFNNSGVYSATLGTTGICGAANDQFCYPRGLATDNADRIYVADTGNHRVQIYDANWNYLTTLGTTSTCGQANTQFCSPYDVEIGPDGKVYVADMDNNRVQIFTSYPSLSYLATLGVTREWGGDNNHFSTPTGVAVDNSGNIYVADDFNDRVQMFNSSRTYVRTFGVTDVPYLTDARHFYNPTDAAADPSGNLIILEDQGQRLIKLNTNGVPQFVIGDPGNPGGGQDRFCWPKGVATDSAGRIYVADDCNHRIQIYTSDGVYSTTIGIGYGAENNQFNSPQDVAVGANGYIYVADTNNHRIQVYDNSRNYITTLGETGISGSDNAHFNAPRGVAVDQADNIYVADTSNIRVQKCTLSGVCSTFAGVTGEWGDDFGHFSEPDGVAVDNEGRVYVVDQHNRRVQVFDQSGAYLTTIGGSFGQRSGQNTNPVGVEVDAVGNVYVVDASNHRIQKFAPGVPGWVQSNINGFGDRRNWLITALATFGGQLYAGTYNSSGSGAQIWRLDSIGWTAVITNGFGNSNNVGIDHLIEFNGQVYASTANRVDGGEVWRSSDGLNWSRVARQGFGVPTNSEIFRLAVFSDTIYASTWSYTTTHGAEIWRSSTGISGDWTRVVTNGFDDANRLALGVLSFESFNGYLYAGTYNSTTMTSTGGTVWRSPTGDAGTWAPVSTNGFGAASNLWVSSLAAFNSYLYAGTYGPSGAGSEIWRCQVCDGSDWTKVVDNGFGNSNNRGGNALEVFNGYLYAATTNSATGMEVWRSSTGNIGDWTQVAFAGFGDSNNRNGYFDNAMTVFNDRLYSGTSNSANGGEVWRKTVVTADFTASPTSGPVPLTVTFTNTSAGEYITSRWDFGDGITSTLTSPTHTYTTAGSYTVTLTVGDGVDSNTVTRTNYITVYTPVSADFTASPASGIAPLTVVFTNTSTGDYTTSLWDFGDGITSTLASPTHIYTAAGVYTVTLMVSGPGGSDTEAKAGYITVRYSIYLPLIMCNHNQ